MSISVLSNYAGGQALALLLLNSGPVYLAAHETDPTVTGLTDTEVAGGGYGRQRITFANISGKGTVSTNKQRFSGMPECIVQYLAVWTALSAGDLVFTIFLDDADGNPAPISVAESAALDVAVGDIGISL